MASYIKYLLGKRYILNNSSDLYIRCFYNDSNSCDGDGNE